MYAGGEMYILYCRRTIQIGAGILQSETGSVFPAFIAWAEEMPLKIPYAYRTLLDVDGRNDDLFDTCYCSECFNGHDFKSLEWVKVKPKFCERKYRGRLIEDEEIWHDLEGEFIKGMKKYSIPYEAEDGMYIVYGYR